MPCLGRESSAQMADSSVWVVAPSCQSYLRPVPGTPASGGCSPRIPRSPAKRLPAPLQRWIRAFSTVRSLFLIFPQIARRTRISRSGERPQKSKLSVERVHVNPQLPSASTWQSRRTFVGGSAAVRPEYRDLSFQPAPGATGSPSSL